ncbi:MAG: hypothetical protein RIE08_14910 [Acidimicrobiales bacterium]
MNFKLGFIAGAAAGYSLSQFLTADQRRKLEQRLAEARDNPRISRVTDSVRRNAGQVADAVTDRVTSAAATAGDAVTGAVDATNGSTTPDGFGSADRPPTAAEELDAEKAAETAPDVGDTYDEMARLGAENTGEGRVP